MFTVTPAVKGRTETTAATFGPNGPKHKKLGINGSKFSALVIVREINSEIFVSPNEE